MKRLIAILTHPRLYALVRKDLEMMMVFHCACTMLGIEKPTVWDIDKINSMMNTILQEMYKSSVMRDMFKEAAPSILSNLWWTVFLSKFKCLVVSRECTKRCFDIYTNAKETLTFKESEREITLMDAIQAHIIMAKDFHKYIGIMEGQNDNA